MHYTQFKYNLHSNTHLHDHHKQQTMQCPHPGHQYSCGNPIK